jgi:hypothetical protein
MEHILRRALNQVREPHQQATLAHADRVLDPGVRIKLYLQLRHRRAGTELAIGLLEDFEEFRLHQRSD